MFESDREHIHHRLLAMGLTHRDAVLMIYIFASGLSVLAIIAVVSNYRNAGAILLIFVVCAYFGIRELGYQEITLIRARTVVHWFEQMILTRLSSLFLMDVVLITTAYWAAFVLKYDGLWVPGITTWHLAAFPFVLLIQSIVFLGLGLYRGIWRAMGIADLLALGLAGTVAALLSYVVSVIYAPPSSVASFFAIEWGLLQILVIAGRSANMVLAYVRRRDTVSKNVHVLIYGAGRRGESILRELQENRELDLCPIGFLDDDPNLVGLKINGINVLGSSHELGTIIHSRKISAVIISTHRIAVERLVSVVNFCSEHRIPVLRGDFQLERLSAVGPFWSHTIAEGRDQVATRSGVGSPREHPTTAKVGSP